MPTLRPCSRLEIGDYKFTFATEIEVNSSWENITQTAKISVAKGIVVDGKPLVEGNNAAFKPGDLVNISLGYDFQYDDVFQGYVTYVKLGTPLEIQCEDSMYLFKKQSMPNKTFKQVTVKQLVDWMASQLRTSFPIVYSFGDMQLGNFRISNHACGSEVFEELRQTYGIYSFFRQGTLYVGFATLHGDTTPGYRKDVDFYFQENIIDDNLEFRTADQFRVQIQGTVIIPTPGDKDKSFKVTAGPDDAEQKVQLTYYNKTKSVAQALVNNELSRTKVAGFKGDFYTFGQPFVRQGDAAVLHDRLIPERNGTYEIRGVRYNYGMGGYRQTIFLERRLG